MKLVDFCGYLGKCTLKKNSLTTFIHKHDTHPLKFPGFQILEIV